MGKAQTSRSTCVPRCSPASEPSGRTSGSAMPASTAPSTSSPGARRVAPPDDTISATEASTMAPLTNSRAVSSSSSTNHPKVIHAISHLMRVLNVNITSLQTQETSTNGPETRPFQMELSLAVPREVPIVKLREYLDALCGDMQVRYELSTL